MISLVLIFIIKLPNYPYLIVQIVKTLEILVIKRCYWKQFSLIKEQFEVSTLLDSCQICKMSVQMSLFSYRATQFMKFNNLEILQILRNIGHI